MSPYEVLGVDPSASDQEIRRVYVELARRHHPDFFAGADEVRRAEADRRMRQINEAWHILGDPARRAAYDRDQRLRRTSPAAGPSVVDRSPKRAWRPVDPDDGADEPDPRDLVDDTPIGDGSAPPRGLPLAVTVLFLAAVGASCAGLVARSTGLLALGMALFGLAVVTLLAGPVIALGKSWSTERAAGAGGRSSAK